MRHPTGYVQKTTNQQQASLVRNLPDVEVSVLMRGEKSVLKVQPADDYVIDKYKIVQIKDQKVLT